MIYKGFRGELDFSCGRTNERTDEGVPRGPRGPKNHPVYHVVIIFFRRCTTSSLALAFSPSPSSDWSAFKSSYFCTNNSVFLLIGLSNLSNFPFFNHVFSRPCTDLGSSQPTIKRTIDVGLWKSSSPRNSCLYYESCHNHNQPWSLSVMVCHQSSLKV